MAEYTNSAGVPSLNAALMHTLQRHRDILQVIHWAWDFYVIIRGFWVFFTPWREHVRMYLGEQREKSSKRVDAVLWKFVLFCFFFSCYYKILKMLISSVFCLVKLNHIHQSVSMLLLWEILLPSWSSEVASGHT